MKILFLGLSSKFIHTLPSGWFLGEYLLSKGIEVEEVYHNVNEPYEKVLDIVSKKDYDILLLSVYIFNVTYLERLAKDLTNIHPHRKIVAGGPEVSETFPATHIVMGEGEEALYQLLTKGGERIIKEIPICNLDDIPSPYTKERLEKSKNKLIYYEASRGCPFSCSYCMASLSNGVRYFSVDRVKSDLKKIVAINPKVIKFTDRTFNMNTKRTNEIFTFILENFKDTSTCFHFEVGGDLFKESTLDILSKMPHGLIQMEAGVQTLNPPTLKAINRVFRVDDFIKNIEIILGFKTIHMHLDLIAGLPLDTLETFKKSFNRVIALKPDILQLGFLKVLKGTPISQNYDASFDTFPPYEVISTPTMSKDDLDELRGVEGVLNKLYNKGKFTYFLGFLLEQYNGDYYQLFLDLSIYLKVKGIVRSSPENQLLIALLDFVKSGREKAKNILKFDYLTSNNSRNIPHILRSEYSVNFKRFKRKHKNTESFLYEQFSYLPEGDREGDFILKFDYRKKDLSTKRYRYSII